MATLMRTTTMNRNGSRPATAMPSSRCTRTALRHVRDVFGGVDLEMAIHAEAFAGGAEQRQENDGEGVQEKKPVAPLRSGDAKNAWAHAETKVLGVAKARLDRPALGVIVDDPACARLGVAGGQTPGLFHVPGLDADD